VEKGKGDNHSHIRLPRNRAIIHARHRRTDAMTPSRLAATSLTLLLLTACQTVEPRVPFAAPGERRFVGTVESIDTGCYADGECSMLVDGKKVVWLRGWSRATWGQVQQPPDVGTYVGKRVEVWCKVEDDHCTLEGNAAYFIRPAS
jgi:hypothetical protein